MENSLFLDYDVDLTNNVTINGPSIEFAGLAKLDAFNMKGSFMVIKNLYLKNGTQFSQPVKVDEFTLEPNSFLRVFNSLLNKNNRLAINSIIDPESLPLVVFMVSDGAAPNLRLSGTKKDKEKWSNEYLEMGVPIVDLYTGYSTSADWLINYYEDGNLSNLPFEARAVKYNDNGIEHIELFPRSDDNSTEENFISSKKASIIYIVIGLSSLTLIFGSLITIALIQKNNRKVYEMIL